METGLPGSRAQPMGQAGGRNEVHGGRSVKRPSPANEAASGSCLLHPVSGVNPICWKCLGLQVVAWPQGAKERDTHISRSDLNRKHKDPIKDVHIKLTQLVCIHKRRFSKALNIKRRKTPSEAWWTAHMSDLGV